MKYDCIFCFLIWVLRVLYVVSSFFILGLLLDSEDVMLWFVWEVRGFVFVVVNYFFDIGIVKVWRWFEIWFDIIEVIFFNFVDSVRVGISFEILR